MELQEIHRTFTLLKNEAFWSTDIMIKMMRFERKI